MLEVNAKCQLFDLIGERGELFILLRAQLTLVKVVVLRQTT